MFDGRLGRYLPVPASFLDALASGRGAGDEEPPQRPRRRRRWRRLLRRLWLFATKSWRRR